MRVLVGVGGLLVRKVEGRVKGEDIVVAVAMSLGVIWVLASRVNIDDTIV